MEKVMKKRVIQKRDLALLKDARDIGFTCCIVSPGGVLLGIGVSELIKDCDVPEMTFYINDVLTWESVPCAL